MLCNVPSSYLQTIPRYLLKWHLTLTAKPARNLKLQDWIDQHMADGLQPQQMYSTETMELRTTPDLTTNYLELATHKWC